MDSKQQVDPLIQQLRDLGPDAIRERLEAVEGEEKALRMLLRAALRVQRKGAARA